MPTFVAELCAAGLVILMLGGVTVRDELAAGQGLDKLIVLGPTFFAAALAVFGSEHLLAPKALAQLVPHWMPGRLFWAYLVGFALVAAALSLSLKKLVRATAPLLGLMFVLFVLMIHIPNVVQEPGNRTLWAVMVRDTSFAGGAIALAGTQLDSGRIARASLLIGIGRTIVAVAACFFAIELVLHPDFAPGVPLKMMTPAWVPLAPVWGYLTGTVFLIGGIALLVNRNPRTAAAAIGLVLVLLTVCLYLPVLVMAKPEGMVEGVNYVFDTLLEAGAFLLVAGAMRPALAGALTESFAGAASA